MNEFDSLPDIPTGFGMALMQNEKAMKIFSELSETEKKKWIEGTHKIKSRQEMRYYVNEIAHRTVF